MPDARTASAATYTAKLRQDRDGDLHGRIGKSALEMRQRRTGSQAHQHILGRSRQCQARRAWRAAVDAAPDRIDQLSTECPTHEPLLQSPRILYIQPGLGRGGLSAPRSRQIVWREAEAWAQTGARFGCGSRSVERCSMGRGRFEAESVCRQCSFVCPIETIITDCRQCH
jgi:hypothetical protein